MQTARSSNLYVVTPQVVARPRVVTAPRIIAVGGGKGGVGKSVLTANMGIALAKCGKRCILVDADLGGSNLHTLMGIPQPSRTITDFLQRRVDDLREVAIDSSVPGLRLISSAWSEPGMANLNHAQKLKVIRHLRQLDADIVLLDLGSGTAFNTLDFFLASQVGVMVTAPSPTSVENMYEFLKAVFHRRLSTVTKNRTVEAIVKRVVRQRREGEIRTPKDLIARVLQADFEAGRALAWDHRKFSLKIIVNQSRKLRERDLGNGITAVCKNYFGMDTTYLGCIDEDDHVWESVQIKRPVLSAFPSSPFARSVQQMVQSFVETGGSGRHART
jgi:flagellar biosynthesis protein FlhG